MGSRRADISAPWSNSREHGAPGCGGGACTAVSYSPGREGLQRRAALPYKYPESRVHSSVGDPLLQEGLPKGLRKALLLWGARCTQPDGVWGSHVSASRTHGWK